MFYLNFYLDKGVFYPKSLGIHSICFYQMLQVNQLLYKLMVVKDTLKDCRPTNDVIYNSIVEPGISHTKIYMLITISKINLIGLSFRKLSTSSCIIQ